MRSKKVVKLVENAYNKCLKDLTKLYVNYLKNHEGDLVENLYKIKNLPEYQKILNRYSRTLKINHMNETYKYSELTDKAVKNGLDYYKSSHSYAESSMESFGWRC